MSVPISFIKIWIKQNAGLLSIISGRLPTTGHGNGPGGSGTVADEHGPLQIFLLGPNDLWTMYTSIITASSKDTAEQVPSIVETADSSSLV
jgi:hypothetical protein